MKRPLNSAGCHADSGGDNPGLLGRKLATKRLFRHLEGMEQLGHFGTEWRPKRSANKDQLGSSWGGRENTGLPQAPCPEWETQDDDTALKVTRGKFNNAPAASVVK